MANIHVHYYSKSEYDKNRTSLAKTVDRQVTLNEELVVFIGLHVDLIAIVTIRLADSAQCAAWWLPNSR